MIIELLEIFFISILRVLQTNIKRKLPPQLLFVLFIFLSLPILIYFAYLSVFAKNIVIDDEAEIASENSEDNYVLSETTIDEMQHQQP